MKMLLILLCMALALTAGAQAKPAHRTHLHRHCIIAPELSIGALRHINTLP